MRFDDELKTDFRMLKVGAFKQWYSNKLVPVVGERATKMMSIAEYWLTCHNRREYAGIEFKPIGLDPSPGFYNLWQGFSAQPRQGDCSKFLAHIRDNVAQGDEGHFKWVMGWFAQIFQRPAEKSGTSLVLRGQQGVGKTIIGVIIGSLLGPHGSWSRTRAMWWEISIHTWHHCCCCRLMRDFGQATRRLRG